MTAICHPIPASAAQDFLAQATRALCDRPGETPAQGASRTRQMVHTIMGFEPRDGLEYMLATLIQGQFHIVLNAMGALLKDETPNPRALSGIAALNRAFLGLLRESRAARKRPLEQQPATTQTQPADTAPPPQTTAPAPKPEKAAPPPPAKQSPVPGKSAPDWTNLLFIADFPPGADPDDDARLIESRTAFQQAHAAAKATLAETGRRLSRTATGR